MPRITALRPVGRGARLNLYIDGAFAFALDAAVAVRHGLRQGRQLDDSELTALRAEGEHASINDSAWRLLSIRARSRSELRQRLLRKGLDPEAVEADLDRLESQGHLDDADFARTWIAARQLGSAPRGSALLRAELRRKGVDADLVREALEDGDDAAAAAAAAEKRAGSLRALPYSEFRRRLFSFLQRRGFAYDVARTAVDAAWRDIRGTVPNENETGDFLSPLI